MLDSKKYIFYLLLIYAFIGGLSIYFFNGTGDDSDSIAHFLFARYAPFQPALYFDHWAKPVFVLVASPFAQFGFNGVKIFNLSIALCTIFCTYHIALKLNKPNPLMAALILMAAPLYYILTFSALTEPLFALFVALGVLLCLNEKYIRASVLLSFLPYVRSEGLLIIGVFCIYLLLKNKWQLLPFLALGSAVYGIAGYFVYKDVFWVITKIPYASLSSPYGSGTLFHFTEQLVNVLGVPIYILFIIGLIYLIRNSFKSLVFMEERVLLLLTFVVFFISHSLFWYLGIFNSMGLKRVFVAVLPLMSIISLEGYNFIVENVFTKNIKLKRYLQISLIGYICIFPFTSNPSAIQWQKDMMLSEKQILAKQTAHFILAQNKDEGIVWCNNFYLSMVLNKNHFDQKQRRDLSRSSLTEPKNTDLLIWDKRYAEQDIQLYELSKSPLYSLLFAAKSKGSPTDTVYAVFQRK